MDVEKEIIEEEIKDPSEDEVKPPEEKDPSEDDEEEIITIGEEEAPPVEEDSSLVRKLRGVIKSKNQEARELRQKLSNVPPTEKPVELGPKPTFESCELDSEKYETSLATWLSTKNAQDSQKQKEEEDQKLRDVEWQKKLDDYGEKKAAMKVSDFDEAEHSALESFSQLQRAMIIDATENSARVIYAIGKRPELLKELSGIKNPTKFIARVAVLEKSMKVTRRRPATSPEIIPRGSGVPGSKVDKQLEKLRAEAANTNDYSKVNAYKKSLREK